MRDVASTLMVISTLPFVATCPHLGVLVFNWLIAEHQTRPFNGRLLQLGRQEISRRLMRDGVAHLP